MKQANLKKKCMQASHLILLFRLHSSKIQIIGSHLKEEPTSPVPLRLGIFKPEDGTREKLRETLHEVLKIEMEERRKEKEAKEDEIAGHSTNAPVNTVTISRNTRYC